MVVFYNQLGVALTILGLHVPCEMGPDSRPFDFK